MKKISLEFTTEELGILTTMASDQLFRKQFIDSKMPGFRPNREELDICKSLVGRLRAIVDEQRTKAAAHTEKADKKVAALGARLRDQRYFGICPRYASAIEIL